LAVAMMRPPDKVASYNALAASLARLDDLGWQLLIVGDGPARAEVESRIERAAPGRARFLGEMDLAALAPVYAACDVFAWPAVNEAYGMAMLEAQAAGLPVVSSNLRGVPDVVIDGRTGLLAPPGDEAAFAACLRELLVATDRRTAMGRAAIDFIAGERGIDVAAQRLSEALGRVQSR
jgi:glycosyltransferase involved in cell wall biosynthesis